MKRILMAVVLGFLATTSSLAIPALANRLFTQRQPDGTVLSYRLVGDEHFHYYATADNIVLARNAAGALCYAKVENGTLDADVNARPQRRTTQCGGALHD